MRNLTAKQNEKLFIPKFMDAKDLETLKKDVEREFYEVSKAIDSLKAEIKALSSP